MTNERSWKGHRNPHILALHLFGVPATRIAWMFDLSRQCVSRIIAREEARRREAMAVSPTERGT